MNSKAKLFRRAAMNVDRYGYGCCDALTYASSRLSLGNENWHRSMDIFRLFKPVRAKIYWWGYPYGRYGKGKQARVLALLFCEQIAKDENG